jgi:hypothetical protein
VDLFVFSFSDAMENNRIWLIIENSSSVAYRTS